MKATECFNKVKKDCFKFIKSQETSTEKFSKKDITLIDGQNHPMDQKKQ